MNACWTDLIHNPDCGGELSPLCLTLSTCSGAEMCWQPQSGEGEAGQHHWARGCWWSWSPRGAQSKLPTEVPLRHGRNATSKAFPWILLPAQAQQGTLIWICHLSSSGARIRSRDTQPPFRLRGFSFSTTQAVANSATQTLEASLSLTALRDRLWNCTLQILQISAWSPPSL